MNKATNWMLTALLTIGLSMGFIACSDDDDDNNGGVPTNEAEYQESQLGWDIITQLTSERTAPEGWQNMTFEPTIGKASEADPYTRIVSTNDVAAAAERFGGLVGLPDLISETTTSFTYNQEGMGKLTYQMGSVGGQYLAQVDVDLKQVPHLKKILYQTPEQMGNNSSFAGTAWYRFGDVVQDQKGYYWICVRPAFGPEGKEDSHWMCFSHKLPEANIKPYKTSTGNQNYLPTGLGKSTEHMQNAAEMLYAILHPDDWQNTLSNKTKPKMFNDFSPQNVQYHNMYFWKKVCLAWEEEDLFNLVLGIPKETLDNDKEWHMLYSGYSWWFTTSWECTLYEATFKNGPEKKANMHDVTYSKPTKDMHNITLDAKDGRKTGTVSGDFFGNDGKLRWYVRYKKGSELGGGMYNVKLKIDNCTDIYAYNIHYHYPSLNEGPEKTTKDDVDAILDEQNIPEGQYLIKVTKEDLGKIVGQDGKIYNSIQDAEKAKTKAVAMIVDIKNTDYEYYEDNTYIRRAYVETNTGRITKGIAIALEDGNVSLRGSEEDIIAQTKDAYTPVRQYDNTWYSQHMLETATGEWLVPNDYHWQRMLLAYGAHRIYPHDYLTDNVERLYNSDKDNELTNSTAFLTSLRVMKASLSEGDYIIAGGEALIERKLQPLSIKVSNNTMFWNPYSYGNKVRYVLVW